MNKICILGFVLILVGCDAEYQPVMILDCSTVGSTVAEAVIRCAKVANPMSDEEGEDLVLQCEQTMSRLLCPKIPGFYRSGYYNKKPCIEAYDEGSRSVCRVLEGDGNE